MSKARLLRWLPAAAVVGVSWHLSSMPTVEMMPNFWNADKLVHTICYGGLAFCVAFGYGGSGRRGLSRLIVPIVITAAYGMIDEIHQSFTPGRSCSMLDWVADLLGATLGSLAYLLAVRLVGKRGG